MSESLDPATTPEPFSIKNVGRSSALLGVGIGIGQVFGLARSLFVAYAVGASAPFDAVLVAIVMPTVLGNWISNTLRIVLVPAYSHVAARSGEHEARRLLGTVLTYLALAAALSVIVVLAFPDAIVAISGPGLAPATRALAIDYVPILAPMLAFMALANVMTAVFQIKKSFIPVAVSWAAGPMASFVITIVWFEHVGMAAYALGTTVGALVTLLVLLVVAVRHGLMPRPSLTADRRELGWFARRALPQTVASGILQLNLISDRAIATLLSTGAVSALKYGQQIVSEPAAAVSTSWATAVYPAVVDAGGQRASPAMGAAMTTSLRYTAALFIPLTIATIAMAPLVVSLAYGRGAFGAEDVRATSLVVAAFGPMLVLTMAQPVFSAAHNARHRGTLMAATGIANAILNILFNVALGAVFGVPGIALSSSVTLGILLVFLAWRVPADEGFQRRSVWSAGFRSLGASLVPGVPIAIYVWSSPPTESFFIRLATLVSLLAAGALAYLLLAQALRLREPGIVLGGVRDAVVGRLSNVARPSRPN